MSSKQQRLQAKRASQAAFKASKPPKEAPAENRDLAKELRDLDVKIAALNKALYDLIDTCDDKHGCTRKYGAGPGGKYDHFMGKGSTALNEKERDLRGELAKFRLKREVILNKQDPERAARIHAEKIQMKLARKSSAFFSAIVLQEPQQLFQVDQETRIGQDVEVVTRMSVGLILCAESPVRCYHTIDGKDVRCDCQQLGTRIWQLSERALQLKERNKLVLDESALLRQNLLIECGDGKVSDVRFGMGGMGGMVARGLLEQKQQQEN